MASTFLKWLIPGLLTVAGGTVLAVVQTGAAVTSDLGGRAEAVLDKQQFGWADVSVDGRQLVLSGTATTQQAIDDALTRLSGVRGISGVASRVALAEMLSPFALSATLKNGQVTLDGAYPSEPVHTRILAAAGPAPIDQTRLHSGAPDAFEAGAQFGLTALASLDEGQMQLSDTSLSLSGRAKSAAAFESLQTLKQSVPPTITLAALTITPPVASPYVWTAKFDGTALTISGNTPSADLTEQLKAVVPANIPVSVTLQLSSGEPAGFDATALALLKNLLSLESGEASISDGSVSLSGAPASTAIADQVTAALATLGGSAALEPPRVADYTLTIDKADSKLGFTGFAPDAATRDRLAGQPGADVAQLALGRGAPEQFGAALDFGLAALSHLSDGRFAIKANTLSLGGRAASVADFRALTELIGKGAPAGLSLATAEVHPPVANPFTFTATKAADGTIAFAGFYPDDAALAALTGRVKSPGSNSAVPADGAPDNFAAQAGKGLDVLALLDSGSMSFDGKSWAIEGTVDTPQKGFAADAAYSIAGLRTAGWTYSVKLPAAQQAAALPIIAPYVWRAQKTADGAVSFTGFVPSDGFKRFLAVRAPKASDSTVLGAGAPADFGSAATAGLEALAALDEGSLGLAGEKWTLTGTVADSGQRESVQNTLSSKVASANWVVAIQAKNAAPVVTPYLWSAAKVADGSVVLEGYVPTDALKTSAAAHAGTVEADSTAIASGEPAGFSDDLLAGLDALSHLATGKAAFDGSKWTLSGDAATAEDGQAATAALAKGSKGGALWTSTVTSPEPSASSAEPSSEPVAADASSAIATPDIVSLEPSSSASEPSSVEAASSVEPVAPSSEQPVPPSSEQPLEPASSSEPPAPAAVESSSSEEPAADRDVAPTSIEVTTPLPDSLVFSANKPRGGKIALSGAVPAEATAAYFGVIAGGVKTDKLAIAQGLPDAFIPSGTAGLTALAELSEGQLGFDGTRWWLHGKAKQQAVKDAVASTIAALPDGADWSLEINLLAPIEVCRDTVDALAARNAITFKPGKAELMANSMAVLDELANDLAICPANDVHVQGYTDADGDADANLALSVMRAEAVVAELIKRGVAEERLYAEGFGETQPIAPNDTKDNKAKNRRIAFAITGE